MRILFVVGTFPSLSETFVLNQITGFLDRGHDVHIYATAGSKTEKVHPDVTRYNLLERTSYRPVLPASGFGRLLQGLALLSAVSLANPALIPRLMRGYSRARRLRKTWLVYDALPLFQHEPYDMILCHFGPQGITGCQFREIGALTGKLATVFHGYDITTYLTTEIKDAYSLLFEQGDLFLPISNRWKQRLQEICCPVEKITVHRMGIDCRQFTFRERTLQFDERLQLVTVARLTEKKGVEFGLRAVALLLQSGYPVTYAVLGDGPLRADLEALKAELQLGDAVQLRGWCNQEQITASLAAAHILVAPSITASNGDQEGIPVALMEAMAMGLPVVTTLHSGIPELVEDGVCGFMVPEGDAVALAEKIGWLIDHADKWAEMGRDGRRIVEEKHEINILNDQLLKIIQSVA